VRVMLSTRPTARVTLLMRWMPKCPLLARAFGQLDRANAAGREVAERGLRTGSHLQRTGYGAGTESREPSLHRS
jgi:hypothetical protein